MALLESVDCSAVVACRVARLAERTPGPRELDVREVVDLGARLDGALVEPRCVDVGIDLTSEIACESRVRPRSLPATGVEVVQ